MLARFWSGYGRAIGASLLTCLIHISVPAWAGDEAPMSAPDVPSAAALVRATLLSLNEANLTGNYSVLRDASAPEFRRGFTEARLASIFAVLREKRVDLSTSVTLEPVIAHTDYMPSRHVVAYRGRVPAAATGSLRFDVNFDVAYQYVEGRWRLFMLDLSLDPAARQPHIAGVTL